MTKVRLTTQGLSKRSGLIVKVLRVPQDDKSQEAIGSGEVVAEGTTDEQGEWTFDESAFSQPGRYSVVISDPATGTVLQTRSIAPNRLVPELVEIDLDTEIGDIEIPGTSDGSDSLDPELNDNLDDLDRPGGTGGDGEPTPEISVASKPRSSYTQILANSLQRDNLIREAEAELIGPVVLDSFLSRRAATEAADKLLGQKPIGKKPAPHFVPYGTNLAPRLDGVVQEGISRISDISKDSGAGLTVRPGPLADLLPTEGGIVPPQTFNQIVSSLMSGNSAQRRASPLERCLSEKRARSEIARLSESEAPEGEDTAPTTSAAAKRSADQDGLDEVIERLLSGDTLASRPTVDEVASSLQIELPPGPADATAYYDYSSLQIAWEDTWTGMVDSGMRDQVRDLYDSVVQTMPEEVNQSALENELGELDDLEDFLDGVEDAASAVESTLLTDTELAAWIPEISDKWHLLTPSERDHLGFLYDVHVYVGDNHSALEYQETGYILVDNETPLSEVDEFQGYPDEWLTPSLSVHQAYDLQWAEKQANVILDAASEATGSRIGRVDELITDLKTRIAQPYQFDVFVPNSYNFGLLVTYRQEWRPLSYQAGDLAGTIALAPNETRRYSTRHMVKSSTSTSRTDSSTQTDKSTSEQVARSEGEIMRRAESALNASANASVGFSLGVTFDGGGSFSADQGSESSQTKRDIRESTFTAAQEFRDERKVEITRERSSEFESTEEREISNPNNEITVTYLFYELQRRFEVAEKLYNVEPVILVAFEVPTPDQIDETWLLEHEWILHKVLLDRSLHPVLRMLSQDFAGDELAVEVHEEQWKTQIAIVNELREQLEGHSELREEARAAIQRAAAAAKSAAEEAETDQNAPWRDVAMVAVGGVGALLADQLFKELTDDPAIAPTTSDESAREALDWADTDFVAAKAALRSGVSALETATERYVQAVQNQLNRRVRIDKLILHVKANILHYMQAIWRHEHPDQRYLRVYDLEVAWPSWDGAFVYAPDAVPSLQRTSAQFSSTLDLQQSGTVQIPEMSLGVTKKLHQVADLSKVLGFKGNYAIFALREQNALTTTMAINYLDTEFGVNDPDPSGIDLTTEEAIELAECAWTRPDTTEDDKKDIAEWLIATLDKAHAASQEIIVPTGELFIEALPGTHPILEDFKLKHREADSSKAAAEARAAEIEALRRAARLKAADLADPDVDKRIEIHGDAPEISIDSNG